MKSLLLQIKAQTEKNNRETIENKLMIEFRTWAITNGYKAEIVDAAINQTINQGVITRLALTENLSDKNIKSNRSAFWQGNIE